MRYRDTRGRAALFVADMRTNARDFGSSFYGAASQDVRIEPTRGGMSSVADTGLRTGTTVSAAGPRGGTGPGTPRILPVNARSPWLWIAVVGALFLIEV